MKKQTIFLLTICILSFAAHLLLFPQLPQNVPIHWNAYGEADNWGHKSTTLFLALLPFLMLLLFRIIPKLDPRGKNYEKHQKAYQVFVTFFVLFLTAILWINNAASLGYPVPIERLVPIGVGILFLAIGNYMPQLRTNYTMGIKNPWTLESEWVWKKTHAAGGVVFILMGFSMVLNGFLPTPWMAQITVGIILLGVLGLEVYSYLLYQKWKSTP
ncbi:MAG: SdpI family protein [Lachnospiraceae bacterium]|jgi:uncharacterized membrane protein|nr:SdpI family protein [Lachnospiraceae bacterium]